MRYNVVHTCIYMGSRVVKSFARESAAQAYAAKERAKFAAWEANAAPFVRTTVTVVCA